MVVYSLPHLVVFRQGLWLWRKETILTNKPIFLMFFLKYWPLKGLYFPDVWTKAGIQRREQLICDWVLPPTWRGVICNPNECLLFCHCTGHVQGLLGFSVSMSSQLLGLFLSRASRTCILCIHSSSFPNPSAVSLLCIRTANAQPLQEAVGWFWGPVFVKCKKDILFFTSQLALVS